jgi:hypothetical protein
MSFELIKLCNYGLRKVPPRQQRFLECFDFENESGILKRRNASSLLQSWTNRGPSLGRRSRTTRQRISRTISRRISSTAVCSPSPSLGSRSSSSTEPLDITMVLFVNMSIKKFINAFSIALFLSRHTPGIVF